MRIPADLLDERFGRPTLEGWKAIAAALGDSVRTVQRYQNMDDPIPVRRKPSGGVWMYAEELTAWAGSHGLG